MPDKKEKGAGRVFDVLRAYFRIAKRYPVLLTTVLVSTTAMQIATVVGPLYIRNFINIVSTGTPSANVIHALLITLTIYAFILLISWLSRRGQMISIMRLEAAGMADLTNEAFAYLISHSYDFFSSNFAGTLTRRVTRYSRSFEQVIDSIVLTFYPTFLFAIGAIAVLFTRNHLLGIGLFIWTVTFVVFQVWMSRWRHPLKVERAALDSKMTGVLSDAVGNHSAVMFFAAEEHEEGIVASVVELWRAATMRTWTADALIFAIQGLLSIAVEIALLVGAVYLWRDGKIQVGDFVLIQVYILGLTDQLWNIGSNMRRLYDAFTEAYEMLEIIERPHYIVDSPQAPMLELSEGAIAFNDVAFSFNGGRAILSDFSLSIHGGEKVALVGPSGAGKSTVTKLALRLYDVTSGAIRIDGQDLKNISQHSLRSQISLVPQEPILFHRTLRENIRYGRFDATDEEIEAAAKQAHCHEFISALPLGYDTLVGERGVKLSGGERQRVAIARAILKNAPILILDEATSSLDSESEALIQDALSKLMEGKTVIAIAHRLSTIMKMDRIIVMENGRAILSGTHDELLAQGSNLYKKLWEIQAGGFILDDEEESEIATGKDKEEHLHETPE